MIPSFKLFSLPQEGDDLPTTSSNLLQGKGCGFDDKVVDRNLGSSARGIDLLTKLEHSINLTVNVVLKFMPVLVFDEHE
jgi:hypothetical protein